MYNKTTSYIRLLHASPNAPAVDVFANDTVLAEGLEYGEFTPYIPVKPGEYEITIFPSNNSRAAVLTEMVKIPEKVIMTCAVIGELPDIELLFIDEPKEELEVNKSGVKFVHLSPNAPAVDVRVPKGSTLFKDVSYKEATDYLQLFPETYTIEVVPTGTDQVVLIVPNIRIVPNRFYSIYAVGLLGGEPPLQVLIPLDGNSYIDV